MGELTQFELFVMERIGDRAACKRCQGLGVRVYASTAGWIGGAGGSQITSGVCDLCWGSGTSDSPWPSHRKHKDHARVVAEKDARIAELERGLKLAEEECDLCFVCNCHPYEDGSGHADDCIRKPRAESEAEL